MISFKTCLELLEHEAIVREAYKDSEGIWTWGVGVTDASGHKVARYKDKPQTIQRVLEVYVWLLSNQYLPQVMRAFGSTPLAEHQIAAALSFHYNTGAIERADWVKSYRKGEVAQAEKEFMQWAKPVSIIGRRKLERDLFFKGKWSSDGKVIVYEVNKPEYTPRWSSARLVDVRKDLEKALENL